MLVPQSGEQTRAELKDGISELHERTAATVNDTLMQVKSKAEQVKTEVQDTAHTLEHQGRELLVRQLDRISHAAEDGKKVVQASQN